MRKETSSTIRGNRFWFASGNRYIFVMPAGWPSLTVIRAERPQAADTCSSPFLERENPGQAALKLYQEHILFYNNKHRCLSTERSPPGIVIHNLRISYGHGCLPMESNRGMDKLSLNKLTHPALPPTILHRQELIQTITEWVNQVERRMPRIVLLCAPAGYGKTTLLTIPL
jgi:hypothetical protein